MSVQGSPQNTDHSVLTSCHKNKKCVDTKITSRFAGIGDDYRPRQPDRGRHPVQEVSVCPWGTFLNESQPSAKKESIPRRRAGRLGSRTKQPQMQHFKISIGTNEERIGHMPGVRSNLGRPDTRMEVDVQLMWIENEFHHSFTSRSIFADKMVMVVIEGTKFSTKNVFREALTTKLTCKPLVLTTKSFILMTLTYLSN